MRVKLAARLFTTLAMLVAAFQLVLALGVPWGEVTWGGRFAGRLPDSLRAVAVVSLALMVGFAATLEVRVGNFWPAVRGVSRKLAWGVVAYCGLGVLANAITPSFWERIIWLPVVSVMLVCSLIVARSR